MPRKNVESISFHVPIGAAALIKAHADKQGRGISDYLRALVEADFKAAGEAIDLSVLEPGTYKRERDNDDRAI